MMAKTSSLWTVILIAALIISTTTMIMITTTRTTGAYAQLSGATGAFQQQQQQQQQMQPPSSSSFFESPEKGIRVLVPAGYVVEDTELSSPEVQQLLDLADLNLPQFLLDVCPEVLALPAIGGQHRCEDPPGTGYGPREGGGIIGTADSIHVMRFDNLLDKPEFEGVVRQNKNITVDDLIGFNIMWLIGGRDLELDVLKTTNTTVNYYPEGATSNANTTTTNQVPIALPAKLADFVYTIRWDAGASAGSMEYRGFFLHVLGPDGNTGYILAYEQPSEEVASSGEQSWIPPAVAQVFDSFELIGELTAVAAATSSEGAIIPSTPTLPQQSPLRQQQHMQQEQSVNNSGNGTNSNGLANPLSQNITSLTGTAGPLNQGASISIVPGSSSLTTDAYAPNPIQVSTGTTVIWTNDDSQPHTATSGENSTPDGSFDSGILAPAATFEHRFTEAGEYPYFCLLHPNMVGTVSVS